MNEKRKRPPYNEFMAWMLLNEVNRNDLKNLLGLTDSTLSHRLNGTGADFSLDEIRMLVEHFGIEVSKFFYSLS